VDGVLSAWKRSDGAKSKSACESRCMSRRTLLQPTYLEAKEMKTDIRENVAKTTSSVEMTTRDFVESSPVQV
jgi:hypothetical protein